MITAVGLAVLGVGVMLLYAALTNQKFMDELKHALGRP